KILFKIGRAVFAQPGFSVPADFGAYPFAATCALLEITFCLFDGFFNGVIVRFAACGPLNLVSAIACARKDAAEHISRRAQQSARRARERRLKVRHISITAFVTEKLELIAPIC